MDIYRLQTPALVVERDVLQANLDAMSDVLLARGYARTSRRTRRLSSLGSSMPTATTTTEAGRIADLARGRGLSVRGVMGYEGHLMMVTPESEKARMTEEAMALLLAAAADVGGDVISAGG